MLIRFTLSGGFAGLVRRCELDTVAMPADERVHLEALVERAGLCESREHVSEQGRDLEMYEIAVEDRHVNVVFVCDSATLTQPVKPLVAYLKRCARIR